MRQIVIDTCIAGNGKKFQLYAVVVMPDHVHIVLVPRYDADGSFTIAEIMQAIKAASAHRINKVLGRKGKVWEEESFDRALRREESIEAKIHYILDNPVGVGLAKNSFGVSVVVEAHRRNRQRLSCLQKRRAGRPSSIYSCATYRI